MNELFYSLRGRFLLAMMSWVLIGLAGIWYSTSQLFASNVEEEFRDERVVHVQELAALADVDAAGNPVLVRPLSDPRYALPMSGYYWQVARNGFRPLRSASLTRGSLDAGIAGSLQIANRNTSGPTGPAIGYGLVRRLPGGEQLRVVIATDLRHLDADVDAFRGKLAVWLGMLAVALTTSGVAVVTFGLRPIAQLGVSISALHSGQSETLEGEFPSEIEPLVADLNAYAERNREIVERARVQAASLAHSLRTPLAVITDEAEHMLGSDNASETARGQALLSEAERMRRQIDYHLARSRSSGSREGIGNRCRLEDVLPRLFHAMHRIHRGKSFEFPLTLSLVPAIACDEDDLNEALSNLLDNAGKFARSLVRVSARGRFGELRLTIEDDGPGIRAEDRAAALALGVSLEDVPEVSGLGLAISRDIARDYGGDLILEDSPLGGLGAVLVLPQARE